MTIAAAVAKEAMQHTQEIKKEEDKIVSLKNVEVVKSPTKETTKSTSESTPHSEISVPTEPLSEEFRKELFDLSTAYKEKFLIKFKKSVSDMYKQFHEKLQDEQNSEELLTTIRSICLTFTQEVFAQANMKQAARDINEIQGAISAILNRLDTVQETALRLRDINNRLKQKLLQNNQTPGLSEVDQKLKDEIKAKDQLIKKYEVELKARDTEITTLKKKQNNTLNEDSTRKDQQIKTLEIEIKSKETNTNINNSNNEELNKKEAKLCKKRRNFTS